jgi:hypothetical protein
VTFDCSSATCSGGKPMGTAQTDNRGDFTLLDAAAPSGAAVAAHVVGAHGNGSGLCAQATFTVS